ncbi:MAG: hypothetical protein QM811_14835 [Pirellulales bacterium]
MRRPRKRRASPRGPRYRHQGARFVGRDPGGNRLRGFSAPGVNIAALVPQIRATVAPNAVLIVAFAPHVHEAKLDEAKAAGCDVVYTRGQFDRAIPQLIQG